MPKLILRELNENDEAAFLAGYEDWKHEDLYWYSCGWTPGMSFAEHLSNLQDHKNKNMISQDLVPSTMLYGFIEDKIVGLLSIRHELNPDLLRRGGHVGYSVASRYRQKRYATEMFRQGIEICRKLGLEKILITCADQNTPSWKIIEKSGGELENRFFDEEENEYVRRYWVRI